MVENFAVGSTRPSLNTSLLRSFRFLIPPVEMQNRYACIVQPMDLLIQSNIEESARLTHTRDYLLPKLLSGEIEVKAAEKEIGALI
jgi:type I restriction enzyme S subunit